MKLLNFAYRYLWVVILGAFFFLYSYKLTEVPPGINFDEASIGYNASLISDTLRDENDRFLPFFILTLDGKDWKQPSNVYFAALIFKLLGKSYFNLRLISVIYAIVSGFLFYKLLRLFFSNALSLTGLVLFLTAPSLLIQSHLVLENMALLPFFLAWLYLLLSYSLKPKLWKTVLAGIFLGISFYSYKGMRAMVPVYLTLSVLYFLYLDLYPLVKKIRNLAKKEVLAKALPLVLFLAGIAPFLLPINWLNTRYAGAVYDQRTIISPSLYESSLVYFGNFDLSFLFAKGDSMLTHSTGRNGIFLAPTFFLFFLGLFQVAKEKKQQYYFILLTLVLTPILLIKVGSVYRASRLMMYIPLFTVIFTLGVKKLAEFKPIVFRWLFLGLVAISIGLTYRQFLWQYFDPYPKRISQDFSPNFDQSFKTLARLAKETGRTPYIEYDDDNRHKTDMLFFREVYFSDQELKTWPRDLDPFPENALVLTGISGSEEIKNFAEIPSLQSGQRTFYIVGK
jgi:hypothetical protein